MLKSVLLLSWLLAAIACHAQNPSEAPADVAAETVMLNDGYSMRLIGAATRARDEKVDSYKLILRHPDGSEDTVWNPPGTEPNYNISAPPEGFDVVTLFRPDAGIVKDGILGVLIGKKVDAMDAWWLRWDLKKKQMMTMVRFFAQYGGQGYDFIDGSTVKINGSTVTIDDQGRVLRNGKRFPQSHFVYEGQRQTTYWPINQGGKIEVTENAQVWPFVARPAARNEPQANPPTKADENAPPPPKDQTPAAAPSAVSPVPTTPVVQTPPVPGGRQASVWPWVVGMAALAVIVLLVLKRRA